MKQVGRFGAKGRGDQDFIFLKIGIQQMDPLHGSQGRKDFIEVIKIRKPNFEGVCFSDLFSKWDRQLQVHDVKDFQRKRPFQDNPEKAFFYG